MKQKTTKTFNQTIKQFEDQNKSKKLFKKSETMYLMRSFKISNISSEQAIQSYQRLCNKYQSGELKVNASDWHKNQRKLFIWHLICYCEENKITIQDVTDEEWSHMGEIFWNKSPLFLKFQGLSILKNAKRHNWTGEDDQLLKKYVVEIGSNQWNSISKSIFFYKNIGRFISPKQCRQRWFNHICSDINRNQWSTEQDIKILKYTLQMGKRWSAIARLLNTHRTQHMIKNRFNSIINKIRQKKMQNEQSLTRKAIQCLEKGDFDNKNDIYQQKSKSLKISITPPNQQASKNEEEPKKMGSKEAKLRSKDQELQQYNCNELKEGELKDLKDIVNKRERGIITFNNEEGCFANNEGSDFFAFSLTPNSVKAISPGFAGQVFRNYQNYLYNEKRRQDGTSLFSPACFSPGISFSSFSPGFFPIPDRSRDEKSLSNSQTLTTSRSLSLQYPHIHSDLSRQYQLLMNNKKQYQQ